MNNAANSFNPDTFGRTSASKAPCGDSQPGESAKISRGCRKISPVWEHVRSSAGQFESRFSPYRDKMSHRCGMERLIGLPASLPSLLLACR
jgi:hypothetical protein